MMKRLSKPAALAVAALIALCATAPAAQPPGPGCRPATKIEYRSAQQQHLLRNRFGGYVRTGHFWRRQYWYCPG